MQDLDDWYGSADAKDEGGSSQGCADCRGNRHTEADAGGNGRGLQCHEGARNSATVRGVRPGDDARHTPQQSVRRKWKPTEWDSIKSTLTSQHCEKVARGMWTRRFLGRSIVQRGAWRGSQTDETTQESRPSPQDVRVNHQTLKGLLHHHCTRIEAIQCAEPLRLTAEKQFRPPSLPQ